MDPVPNSFPYLDEISNQLDDRYRPESPTSATIPSNRACKIDAHPMKLSSVIPSLALALLAGSCFAQKVSKIKPGSPDFKAIIQAVTPYANEHAAHPVRVKGDLLRKSGDWAFLVSRMDFVNPTYKGDGE